MLMQGHGQGSVSACHLHIICAWKIITPWSKSSCASTKLIKVQILCLCHIYIYVCVCDVWCSVRSLTIWPLTPKMKEIIYSAISPNILGSSWSWSTLLYMQVLVCIILMNCILSDFIFVADLYKNVLLPNNVNKQGISVISFYQYVCNISVKCTCKIQFMNYSNGISEACDASGTYNIRTGDLQQHNQSQVF